MHFHFISFPENRTWKICSVINKSAADCSISLQLATWQPMTANVQSQGQGHGVT